MSSCNFFLKIYLKECLVTISLWNLSCNNSIRSKFSFGKKYICIFPIKDFERTVTYFHNVGWKLFLNKMKLSFMISLNSGVMLRSNMLWNFTSLITFFSSSDGRNLKQVWYSKIFPIQLLQRVLKALPYRVGTFFLITFSSYVVLKWLIPKNKR